MILCELSTAWRYKAISPAIDAAISWLADHVADGEFDHAATEIPVPGSDALIMVKYEEPAMIPRERAALEAHRKYIDIHVPLKSQETIGWAPVGSLKHPRGEYDDERDIAFFGDEAHSLLHVKVGQIAIFFPEDAHAPNIGLGNHRKLCVKIPLI